MGKPLAVTSTHTHHESIPGVLQKTMLRKVKQIELRIRGNRRAKAEKTRIMSRTLISRSVNWPPQRRFLGWRCGPAPK